MIQGFIFLGVILAIPVLAFWMHTHYGASSRLSWRLLMAGISTGGLWLIIFIIGRAIQIPATKAWQGTLANALSKGVLLGWALALLFLLSAGIVRLIEGNKVSQRENNNASAAHPEPGDNPDSIR